MRKLLIFFNLLLALITFSVLDNSYSNISEVSTAFKIHEVDSDVSLYDDLPFKH
ncbi:hypothetical protein [Halobacillus hunanensis]|uniref:hypothetical protein n=1 Tax=Halobacillus hunanensis TaxID=578214 RepID=UPI0015927074|nr:hypothetical protein [Halobacillus hunanensis]